MKCIVCYLLVLLSLVAIARALPMTNSAELVALDSSEESQELAHMVIAPRKLEEELVEQRPGLFDTIVEQLHAAGVQTADKRQLQTLSYKELTRLLALWHLTQRRNYYDANENRAPPAFEENDEQNKQQMKPELQ